MPPLQLLTNIVWTVPLVVLIVRRNLRLGVMATCIAGLVILVFIGPASAVLLFNQFAPLGIVYGYLFKYKAGAGKTVAIGSTVSLVALLVNFYLAFLLTGLPLGGVIQELENSMNYAVDFYQRTGMLDALLNQGMTLEQIEQTMLSTLNTFKLLLPGIFISAALLAAFVNYLVAEKILQRLQLLEGGLPPFRYWQLPWYFVWAVITGLLFWQLGDYQDLDIVSQAGLNLLYITVPLLAGNGLAAISFFLHKFKLAPFVKWAMVFISLFYLPIVLIFTVMLGLFDPFLSYRRRLKLPEGKGE
jgi:uncharacterized protein YybS (DUF2232 family)